MLDRAGAKVELILNDEIVGGRRDRGKRDFNRVPPRKYLVLS